MVSAASACLAAHRRVAVRVLGVEQLDERPIRDRARHVAQLGQPVQPELPDALEVGLGQRRPRDHVGEQREPTIREPGQRRHRRVRGVGADVGVELRADPRQILVQTDRGPVAAPLVEHVGGQRRQTFLADRIAGRPALQQHHERDDRNRRVADAPHPQAARQHGLGDGGKPERAGGARLGEPRAVDGHDTTAGAESGMARAWRPRGMMLSVTREAWRR